ncbi:hypothetical protein F4780DRAFT_740150 [Xylariomycetidae sp. FL0641]|nr:hypothetical protein F4780DRAFT_740150 [Xylariomycetidae sp. FL0641]
MASVSDTVTHRNKHARDDPSEDAIPQYQQPAPARKRPQYSYAKCYFCRRDKQKCEPKQRNWPQEKCHRCKVKEFDCSENQKTKTRPEQPPLSVVHGEEPGQLPVDCRRALDWYRMLGRVRRIAYGINEQISQHSRRSAPCRLRELLSILEDDQFEIVTMFNTHEWPLALLWQHTNIVEWVTLERLWYNTLISLREESAASEDALVAIDTRSFLAACEGHAGDNLHRYSHLLHQFWKSIPGITRRSTNADGQSSWHLRYHRPHLHDHEVVRRRYRDILADQHYEFLRRDSLERTLLHVACNGVWVRPEEMLDMLDLGVDINAVDVFGQTALHIACRYQSEWSSLTVRVLLAQGDIDIYVRDGYGLLAIEYAIRTSNALVLGEFLKSKHIDGDASVLEGVQSTYHCLKQLEKVKDRLLGVIGPPGGDGDE